MTKRLALLLVSLVATASFAASHVGAPMPGGTSKTMPEAMKAGDAKAEAAGQAKVDARTMTGDKSAMQPEAMKSGDAKAQSKAEMKKAKKAKIGKKNSTDAQMNKDAAKL
ncbi:MAG: hypothetical protein JWQ33_2685 [Ramlibacter sp.]|nr:hypothetical protein [Ramlibacter sp.]